MSENANETVFLTSEVEAKAGVVNCCDTAKWYPRSVVKGPSDKQTSHLHPTQKPVWLCERLVLTYTNPGEVVLDCCAGSASIGVACCRTGRRYIGIENEKQYYDVMRTRLRECCRSHSKEVG